MHKYQTILPALALCATLFLCACSGPKLIGNPQAPYPLKEPAEVGQTIHLPTGIEVSTETMLTVAADSRIVYVAETHDNPASHRLQFDVLKGMAERYPGKVVLGMEMLTPEQNAVLADWVAGRLEEKEFLRQLDWFKVWSSDYRLYRELFNLAREQQLSVIGLNADKKSVSAIVRNELDELSPEADRIIGNMDLYDPYQKALVESVYGGHSKSEGQLAGFHRAQTLWDETMADSIVRYLTQKQNSDKRMVVIAGGNHIRYGFGIPRRVFRRLPLSYTLIGGREIEIPENKRDKLMDIDLPTFPMVPYDFVTFTRYEELEPKGVKLGVMFSDEEGRVEITMVVPDSNASRAGIRKGDIIEKIDGEPIKDNFDAYYAIKQKRIGDRGTITVQRETVSTTLSVEYLDSKPAHHGKK